MIAAEHATKNIVAMDLANIAQRCVAIRRRRGPEAANCSFFFLVHVWRTGTLPAIDADLVPPPIERKLPARFPGGMGFG